MKYIKMHSYGNKFIILNLIKKKYNIKNIVKKICNKNLNFCFDQIILIKKFAKKNFYLNIFNKDLSKAYNCINGIRSLFYLISKKTKTKKMSFIVKKKKFALIKKNKNLFSFVDKTGYKIKKNLIFNQNLFFFRNLNKFYQINFILKKTFFNIINLGNKHIIFIKKEINKKQLKKILKKKSKINLDNLNISLFGYKKKEIITYERGSGITESCGSATFSICFNYLKYKDKKKLRIFNKYGTMLYINKKKKCLKGKCFKINIGNINENL